MIRDSVSVIIRHEQSYFFITRRNDLRSFPGYTAFPGGKIEENESALEAARREIIEELSFDFFKDKRVLLKKILGEATSPDFNPKRFRNFYFLVELSERIIFNTSADEIKDSFWSTKSDFLIKFHSGHLLCVKPMFTILNFLENNNDYEYQDFRPTTQENGVPVIEVISALKQVMPLSNTIFPATRTNCFVFGDVLIDPSPKDKLEYTAFVKTLAEMNIKRILISHHHKDHHQYSNILAREFNLPLFISRDSYDRILKINNLYFSGIKVFFLKDRLEVGKWKGICVRSFWIPGHDEGHYGFAPDCMSWFIVGDLFQGVGTVVVGGDEGDMDKYLTSLKRVIDFKPKCVIPSHGIPLGGTDILKKTFEHRLLRETQILELILNGKRKNEILRIIYFELPTKLHKYAAANIDSHIIRLIKLGLIKKENVLA